MASNQDIIENSLESSKTDYAKGILDFMKAWHESYKAAGLFNKNFIFNAGWEKVQGVIKDEVELEVLRKFIKITSPPKPPPELIKLWAAFRENYRDEIEAPSIKEKAKKHEKKAKKSSESKSGMEGEMRLREHETILMRTKHSRMLADIEKEIHPTILDEPARLNKRNLMFTGSVILLLAIVSNGDLNGFQILGVKAENFNQNGLWASLLVALAYFSLNHILRISHYFFTIRSNKKNIEDASSLVDTINMNEDFIRAMLKKFNPSNSEESYPILKGAAEPSTIKGSKKALFWILDIIIPATLVLTSIIVMPTIEWSEIFNSEKTKTIISTPQIQHPLKR